jgi:2-haloacid dehalogenase
MSARIIVFDVNETLLDLRALDPHFKRVFGAAAARRVWFMQVLQSAMTATFTESYFDFGVIARAALHITTARSGVGLQPGDEESIMQTLMSLPPHPDTLPALERLQSAGLRLATLTNSTPAAAEAQLAHAGIIGFFEQILSVDAVRKFKPAREVYQMAAFRFGVKAERLRLVAAHDWDVAGAMAVGCAGAFVARPGNVFSPLMKPPDIIGGDLLDVAEQIIASELG